MSAAGPWIRFVPGLPAFESQRSALEDLVESGLFELERDADGEIVRYRIADIQALALAAEEIQQRRGATFVQAVEVKAEAELYPVMEEHQEGDTWSLDALEAVYPAVPWRDAMRLAVPARGIECYTCRVCVANHGLKADSPHPAFDSLEQHAAHMAQAHESD